ncbi:MAG: type II secretion system protein [Planctomycetota bacterium]
MKAKSGFTLVEILIVVVILGILAAIVIPQFTDASTEAKLSSLCSDLQTIRSQIELYKVQHNDDLPGAYATVSFEQAMTQYTVASGALAGSQEPADGVFGPYLQQMPTNPFNNMAAIDLNGSAGGGGDLTGWYYNSTTGDFRADTDGHTTY